MNEKIRSILDREIKMTMGCTDPGAIAYAASKASSLLEGDINNIDITVSKNIYKNAACVGIPVIKKDGIEYAALLGALIKRPDLKLAVLGEISSDMQKKFNDYSQRIPVSVTCSDIDETLYISITCYSNISSVTVIIKGDYDWIYHIEKDNQVIYHNERKENGEDYSYEEWSFKQIYLSATTEDIDKDYLLKYEKINKMAAMFEMSEEIKLYLQRLSKVEEVPPIHEIANMARIYVLNASKMRMSGERVPIVSVAGSGNLGITSILAVSAVCDALCKTTEERLRAIHLSILIAIYIKSKMNRLTVMCGTAVAGAAGSAASTAFLLGGGYEAVENAVNTVIGSIGGMICDGAKESCAFKVSFAAECAVISGFMSCNKIGIKPGSGIITHDIDKNITYIGNINNIGMKEVDNIVLGILHTQKSSKK